MLVTHPKMFLLLVVLLGVLAGVGSGGQAGPGGGCGLDLGCVMAGRPLGKLALVLPGL